MEWGVCSLCGRTPHLPCIPQCPLYLVEPMTDRDPLLQEREKTHGSFADNAKHSQAMKHIFAMYSGGMCEVHREALDMIALKLSRILSGQANYKDHWDDIAGYAKLASEACEPQS